jgi:hypothetical protein
MERNASHSANRRVENFLIISGLALKPSSLNLISLANKILLFSSLSLFLFPHNLRFAWECGSSMCDVKISLLSDKTGKSSYSFFSAPANVI